MLWRTNPRNSATPDFDIGVFLRANEVDFDGREGDEEVPVVFTLVAVAPVALAVEDEVGVVPGKCLSQK
jgi:hypothetical protein